MQNKQTGKLHLVDSRQLRAARAILGLTVQEVATGAAVNRNTVWRTEGIGTLPDQSFAAQRIGHFLARNGIAFDVVNGKPSVRFSLLNEREMK